MSSPRPVLVNGLATSQGIYDVETSPVVAVGTRAALDDGRVYYYARQSSSNAIVAGNLLSAEAASVDMDDMATNTAVLNDLTVNVTPVGTKTYAANELTSGYLVTNSGTTGAGLQYKIRSHAVTTAATEFTVTLFDGIRVAFNADTTAHVVKNAWMDPIIMPTTGAAQPAGVASIAVGAGDTTAQYFWCQTWGMAAVTAGAANAVGDALMADTTTAGETLIATAGNPVIGNAIGLGVNADHVPTFLTIAP